jgi:hypothetical protein
MGLVGWHLCDFISAVGVLSVWVRFALCAVEVLLVLVLAGRWVCGRVRFDSGFRICASCPLFCVICLLDVDCAPLFVSLTYFLPFPPPLPSCASLLPFIMPPGIGIGINIEMK